MKQREPSLKQIGQLNNFLAQSPFCASFNRTFLGTATPDFQVGPFELLIHMPFFRPPSDTRLIILRARFRARGKSSENLTEVVALFQPFSPNICAVGVNDT